MKGYFIVYMHLKSGREIDDIHDITQIDRFFLYKIQNIIDFENYLRSLKPEEILKPEILIKAKRMGFSDAILSQITGLSEKNIRDHRRKTGIVPTYKMVDTCAAEFEAKTPILLWNIRR